MSLSQKSRRSGGEGGGTPLGAELHAARETPTATHAAAQPPLRSWAHASAFPLGFLLLKDAQDKQFSSPRAEGFFLQWSLTSVANTARSGAKQAPPAM